MDVRFTNFIVSIVALTLYIFIGCNDRIATVIPFADTVLCLITLKSGILETLESLVLVAWMISMAASKEVHIDPLFYLLTLVYVVHSTVLGGYVSGILAFIGSAVLLWASGKTLTRASAD